MSSGAGTFTELMAELDYSMLIVTAAARGERAGCLVGFSTQVSIRPARFLVCLSDKNRTFRIAQGASTLAVHFVPEEQAGLAELFGGETGDDVDKFSRCAWRRGPEDTPIITDLENWFAGRVIERLAFGDHEGFLLEPITGESGRGAGTFTFHRAKRIEPGHEP